MKSPWQGLALMVVATVGFAIFGGLVGFALGHFVPGYYQTVFGGDGVYVDPVPTGIGLGVTQGLFAGLLTGAFLVVWFSIRPKRSSIQAEPSRKDQL